ncbi:MAG: bifunctional phosphopantothenoylcysteine decarboxylase/phosphopantothenate--cysteine ligase CoaBC [Ferruginibacter sp.]
MLQGKKILIGVTGSIAAYKSAILVRLLVKEGAIVKVIMTPSSKAFISALTLATLSKNDVLSELTNNDSWANHVMLGRWADVFLIAPLSCNTLAKLANGQCDNLLTAVYLSASCPVIVAPAMDEDMWQHASVKNNIAKLRDFGDAIIPVENGELASGLFGNGRMAEPEALISSLQNFFKTAQDLSTKKILITAGPTYEKIDPVRFIGNHSTGKMGIALAEECLMRGANVTLILGPTSQALPKNLHIIHVQSAEEMYNAAIDIFPGCDVAILSAAVADYAPASVAIEKIKKEGDTLTLNLVKTKDILKAAGKLKTGKQILVGFALETDDEKNNALKKMSEKNADLIVLNSLQEAGAGFGHDTNKIIIFDKNGGEHDFGLKSKKEIATDIINTIMLYINDKN